VTTLDRLAAALADRYRVEHELGAGGMATVYLAEDLKHRRKVALKVLKPELAAVIGGDRFVQEITTTAALQHPHILPLFDSGEVEGFLFYVMPFIDGETLRSKLNRETQFGVEDAIRIACDVADALHYAHAHGVIHRDIKPENILLANGRPMVADFGIALALSAAAGGRMTETGLSLGTPHYMSPEQATAEKEISARADIYSIASVLFEMLTGEPPHMGNSAQQIIMKIITETPRAVTTLRKSVPPHVAAAVAKALEKLPADRFASAAEFAAALNNPSFGPSPTAAGLLATGTPQQVKRTRVIVGVLGVAAIAFAGGAGYVLLRPVPEAPVNRYSMGVPTEQALREGVLGVNLAISPDGRRLVYVGAGDGDDQLWIRERDRLEATPLAGTAGAANPFFSPDGTRIAFSAGNNFELKVVPTAGGPPITLARPGAGTGGGGFWADGWIYFDTQGGLSRMPADGGTPELFIALDSINGEIGHAWPAALPNGGVLYRSRRSLDPTDFDIVAYDPKKRERHVLTKGLVARYVEPGYVVFLRADGAVLAAPFDQDRFRLTGPAVPLFEGVMTKPFGSADIAISPAGTLAYVRGAGLTSDEGIAEVVYVSRDGSVTALNPPMLFNPSPNYSLSLSPDGKMLALDIQGPAVPAVWVKQLPGGALGRLTFEGTGSSRPNWSRDSRYVTYLSADPQGFQVVWRKRADGSSQPETLWRLPRMGISEAFLSANGEWLIYRVLSAGNNRDIHGIRLGRDSVPTPLVAGAASEYGAALSPDGRWLAYISDESARPEIFVRPFPNTGEGRWQVSSRGGIAPRWSHSGRELFFESTDSELMVAANSPGSTFMPGEPRRLFSFGAELVTSAGVPYYDVTPDDQRFVMVRRAPAQQSAGAGQLIIVENWYTELKAKMGAKR
jgi:eukaryotic-like serine/threonine-protein kinase